MADNPPTQPLAGVVSAQTPTGAAFYIQATSSFLDPSGQSTVTPSVLHLRDGITVRPNSLGTFYIRRSDLGSLQNVGIVESGLGSKALFDAYRVN